MRKIFSLLAAVLFAASMMAQVTITPSAITAAEGTEISATIQGVSLNITQGTVTADQIRIFKNQTITISAESNITSIEFTCYAKGAAKYGPGCFTEQDGYTFEADGFTGTWTGSATSVSFVASANQVRAAQIVVTLEGGEPVVVDTYTVAGSVAAIFGEAWNPALTANDMTLANGIYKWEKANLNLTAGTIQFKVVKNHSWDIAYPAQNYELNIAEDGEYTITITFDPSNEAVAAEAVKKEPLADPTNCAEAAEAALSVSANNELYNDGAVYTIEGYVTGIKTAYSDQYHNISFWMADAADGGEVLQAFRAACETEADAPAVGDKVAVTGSLTKYGTTPEFAAGCIYVITEKAVVDIYTVAGSDAAIFGEAWNPALEANDMVLANGIYTWEKAELDLTAGDIEFKVVKNHSWDIAYPAQNYVLNIAEDGEYTITITFDPATEAVVAEAVKKEPLADPTNCAEAAEAALSVSANNELYNNGAVYTIEGYVTGIKTAYSDQYHNISFWMADAADGGEVLQAFRAACETEADAPAVGDKVAVTGSLTKYNTTPEFAAACTYVILERATPVAADTIVIDIESEVQYVDYVAEEGWWQFMAENDEYEISISNLSTTQAAGTYTVADLDADYTYIEIKATETKVHFDDGSLTLTEGEDGSRTIEGVMTGDDGNIYNIKLVFRIPTAETTVNVEIPEWEVYNSAELYGFASYLFAGEAADGTYVQIVILGSNPLGTFTYDDCYTGGTGIQVGDEYKPIYSMNVTVNISDATRAIITADILCLNNTLYHVTTTIGEGINNVEAAVEAIKRIVNGQVVIEKAGKTYNMNGAVIR